MMAVAASPEKARQIPCPRCKAPIGEPCRWPSGGETSHSAREKARGQLVPGSPEDTAALNAFMKEQAWPPEPPTRVMISAEEAVPPARARQKGIEPDIIFIRDDGWSLGAPSHLEAAAERLWPETWVSVLRRPSKVAEPYPRKQKPQRWLPPVSAERLTFEEQEALRQIIGSGQILWTRWALLHALAGASEQGVLADVIDELMSTPVKSVVVLDTSDGTMIARWLTEAMEHAGWMKGGKHVPGVIRQIRGRGL